VSKNLKNLLDNNVMSVKQKANGASYFSKKTIDYSNLKIDLFKTAFEIKCQVKAFYFPSYQLPVVCGYRVYRATILESRTFLKCGAIINDNEFYFDISTIDYDLRLYKDQREGLFESAKVGDLRILKKFITNGYEITQRSAEGWDIAIIAAYNGKFEYLEYVLNELNWDINTKNNNGTTLLMYLMTYASNRDNPEFLEKFIDCFKADLYSKDYFGNDVTFYAEKYANQRIINIFKLNK
jgi:methionyl-tRNA formyltransferase